MTTTMTMPANFQERVTNKVRDVFMDIIPEETLTELVNAEIKAFFETESKDFVLFDQHTAGGWGQQASNKVVSKCTPFRLLVWDEVRKLIQPALNEIFASDKWKTEVNYVNGQQETQLSELLDAKLEAMVMGMAKTMFQNMFAQAVQGAKFDLQQDVQQVLQNAGLNNF